MGVGAVREILKTPRYVERIDTVVLVDSMYAGYDNPGSPSRRPWAEHVASLVDFTRLAAQGKKRVLITYSSILQGTYASTGECARAVVEAIEDSISPVESGVASQSTPEGNMPLIERFDRRGLHVWGYAGDNAQAHMAHARSLADFWLALESVKRQN